MLHGKKVAVFEHKIQISFFNERNMIFSVRWIDCGGQNCAIIMNNYNPYLTQQDTWPTDNICCRYPILCRLWTVRPHQWRWPSPHHQHLIKANQMWPELYFYCTIVSCFKLDIYICIHRINVKILIKNWQKYVICWLFIIKIRYVGSVVAISNHGS